MKISAVSQQETVILHEIVTSWSARSGIVTGMGNGTQKDCQWGSPFLHWISPSVIFFFYLQSSLWSELMTLSPRRSLSDDCIPSWIVLSDLRAAGKYFCNTCHIRISCWTFVSPFGLMPCYVFCSLFSSVTKTVWFPGL